MTMLLTTIGFYLRNKVNNRKTMKINNKNVNICRKVKLFSVFFGIVVVVCKYLKHCIHNDSNINFNNNRNRNRNIGNITNEVSR